WKTRLFFFASVTSFGVTIGACRINPLGMRAAKINIYVIAFAGLYLCDATLATTKGLSQIVTPDLQGEGDLSLSLQIQDKRIANPYELQAELGLTKWAEVAVFQGFDPNEEIFATEFGILTKEPYLLSV